MKMRLVGLVVYRAVRGTYTKSIISQVPQVSYLVPKKFDLSPFLGGLCSEELVPNQILVQVQYSSLLTQVVPPARKTFWQRNQPCPHIFATRAFAML